MTNEVSDDDKKLFRSAVANLKITEPKENEEMPSSSPKANAAWKYGLSDAIYDAVGPETILSYCDAGISRQRFHELKSGQIKWQSKVDLHGVRFESAADTLCHAVELAFERNQRVILVVHGKGGRDGDKPILKNYVNQWLRQLPQVIAFHSALSRDGGTGALYVLLRKNRADHN